MHSRYILFETYLPDFGRGKKKVHATTQTQKVGLYYIAMDIVAKKEWTSNCSYRCYFAISFLSLLMLILHPVVAETQK